MYARLLVLYLLDRGNWQSCPLKATYVCEITRLGEPKFGVKEGQRFAKCLSTRRAAD